LGYLFSYILSGFGDLEVSVLASGTQVRGFKPGRSRRIFKGGKILSTPSFGREVKAWVPCRRFAACKRTLNVMLGKILRFYSRPSIPTSTARVRNASLGAEASVGQSWDVQSGRYNKPAGCSTPVACRGHPCEQTNNSYIFIFVPNILRKCVIIKAKVK
jgi:hypothetical protein